MTKSLTDADVNHELLCLDRVAIRDFSIILLRSLRDSSLQESSLYDSVILGHLVNILQDSVKH